jgi:hypothetical protein
MEKTIWRIVTIMLVSLLLTACGSGDQEPTQDPNLVITQAVETAMAAITQTAMAEPSPTFTFTPTLEPSPTFTPTTAQGSTPLPTQPVPPSGPALSSCDLASFVDDITIPDGTELAPGQTFTKTWRIQNDGTCTWTSAYQVLYYGGEVMSAETAYPLTDTDIAPGDMLDISIEMTAPTAEGSYTMWWIMRNADGENFGVDAFGGAIYVQIVVSSSAVGETATATSESVAETPTETPTPTDDTTP